MQPGEETFDRRARDQLEVRKSRERRGRQQTIDRAVELIVDDLTQDFVDGLPSDSAW